MSQVPRMSTGGRKSQMFFTMLGKLCLNETIHGGHMRQCVYKVFRQYICNCIFSPNKILEYMDLQL